MTEPGPDAAIFSLGGLSVLSEQSERAVKNLNRKSVFAKATPDRGAKGAKFLPKPGAGPKRTAGCGSGKAAHF